MMDRHRDCRFIAGNNMGNVRVGFLSSSWSSQIVLVYRVACQNLPSSVSRAWSQLFVYKSVSVLGLRASREQTKAGVSCGVSSKMLMNRNNLPYLVGGESCRVSPFKSGRVMSRSQRKGNVRCMCNHEALACRVDMACNMYAFKKEPIFAVVVPTINRFPLSLDVIQYLLPACFAFVLEKCAWLQYCRCFLPSWLGLQKYMYICTEAEKAGLKEHRPSGEMHSEQQAAFAFPSLLQSHCNHPPLKHAPQFPLCQPTNAPTSLSSFGRMFCLPECLKGRPTGFSIASSS